MGHERRRKKDQPARDRFDIYSWARQRIQSQVSTLSLPLPSPLCIRASVAAVTPLPWFLQIRDGRNDPRIVDVKRIRVHREAAAIVQLQFQGRRPAIERGTDPEMRRGRVELAGENSGRVVQHVAAEVRQSRGSVEVAPVGEGEVELEDARLSHDMGLLRFGLHNMRVIRPHDVDTLRGENLCARSRAPFRGDRAVDDAKAVALQIAHGASAACSAEELMVERYAARGFDRCSKCLVSCGVVLHRTRQISRLPHEPIVVDGASFFTKVMSVEFRPSLAI